MNPPGEPRHAGWRALDQSQRRVLICTLAANALVFFDQTAVVVALPEIGREFRADAADLQWMITAYLLALAVFMLVAGRVADHFGRRKTFLVGLVIFAMGSALCAVAPSLPLLIAARFLQGIGGAAAQPLAMEIATRAVDDKQRGWAIGALATGGTSFLVIGPLIAGALVIADWRWIFVVPLPVVAFVLAAGYRSIGTSRETLSRPIRWQPIAMLLIGLGSLVFGLVSGEQLGIATIFPAVIGLLVLAMFALYALRVPQPLIEIPLLKNPMLATSLAALFAIQFAVFGVMVSLTHYLQHGLGLSGLAAGAVIALAGIGTPLLSLSAGRAVDAAGPRRLVLPGLVLTTAALLTLGLLSPLGGILVLLPGLIAFAAGRPAVFTPAGIGPFLAFGAEQRAFAASLAAEARQLGAVFGVTVTTAMGPVGYPASFVTHDQYLVQGFQSSVLVAAMVCALTAVAVWRWMPARTPLRVSDFSCCIRCGGTCQLKNPCTEMAY